MDYGALTLNIERILKARGISKNQICKDLDIPRANFNRYCRNDFQRMDTGLICKLCWYLKVEAGERHLSALRPGLFRVPGLGAEKRGPAQRRALVCQPKFDSGIDRQSPFRPICPSSPAGRRSRPARPAAPSRCCFGRRRTHRDSVDVAALTPDRVARLKAVFWDMCSLSSSVETIDHPAPQPAVPGKDRPANVGGTLSPFRPICPSSPAGRRSRPARPDVGLPSDGHWYVNRNLTAVSTANAKPGDFALYPDASHIGAVMIFRGWILGLFVSCAGI